MTELPEVLRTFYEEKLAMLVRHQAGACLIEQYDANNTYQYIINREEVQLSWLESALRDLGVVVPDRADAVPSVESGRDAAVRIPAEDARAARAFVDRWKPRVEALTNARHRGMLRVILGETLEHKRFFEQALAGRVDMLGRRAEELGPARGAVLPTRWVE